MRQFVCSFVMLLLCMSLQACAYHLSGTSEGEQRRFPEVLKYIYIDGINQYDPFHDTLLATLRGYGFKVTAREKATAQLRFKNKRVTQRVHVIGEDVKASEILLRVKFEVSVVDRKNKVLLSAQSMRGETYYLNMPNRLLETKVLMENALRKVEQDLIERLMQRMATIN